MGEAEIQEEKKKNAVEIGESSRGAALRKNKAEKKDKNEKMVREKVKHHRVPRFKITIRKSYLRLLVIPRTFDKKYIKSRTKVYKRHHSEEERSWEVLCLVRKAQTILSGGWSKLAREYPLSIGDRCTLRLVKPTEFILASEKAREEIVEISD